MHKGRLTSYLNYIRHAALIAQGRLGRWVPLADEAQELPDAGDQAPDDADDQDANNDADGDEDNEGDEGDEGDGHNIEKMYAAEVQELVARDVVSVTGAEAMLQSTHRMYQPLLPSDKHTIPKTWYRCKQLASEGRLPEFFTRDYCPKCDFLFPKDDKVTECARCEKNTRYKDGKPARVAYFFDIADKVTRVYASEYSARQLAYGTSRPRPAGSLANRVLEDWWDGGIAQELFHNLSDAQKKDYMFFGCSNDGVEVEKNVSYTPATAKVMNAPPDARGMLGSIWLLGFWPPNIKDHQAMMQPIVEMFAKHAPGEEPIEVYDAHLGERRNKWLVMAQNNNDIRGVPAATCGKNPPALVGSCNNCKQEGVRHRFTTVLPGAVRALPEGKDALRDAYEEEFAAVDDLAAFAGEGRPKKRTKKEAVASGNRVRQGEAKEKDEAFKDVDHHTSMLWYHDKIKHTLYDLAHQLANVLKHILKFMKNKQKKDKQVFTPAARAYEVETLGRFPHLAKRVGKQRKGVPLYSKAPWVSPQVNQDELDSLPDKVGYPTNWPALRAIYKDLGFMKTSETLLLAGDVGAYVLRHAGIDPEYRDLFIEVLRVIERYTHTHTHIHDTDRKGRSYLYRMHIR